MRVWMLVLILVAAACGKMPESAAPFNTEVRRFEPLTVMDGDLSQINLICDSLLYKENLLSVLVSSRYTFSYAEKGCAEQTVGEAQDIQVSIQRPEAGYIFRQQDGEQFPFAHIETLSKGAMAEICQNINNLRSPALSAGNNAIWFTAITSPRHCISDYDHACIQIQTGSRVSGEEYRIHTNEWIRFKIRGERRGFFTMRKLASEASCGSGKYIMRQASLN
jgi:hypothetical protein